MYEIKYFFFDFWIFLDNICVVKIYIFLFFEECGSCLRVLNIIEYISMLFYLEFLEVMYLCLWNVFVDYDYILIIKEVYKINFFINLSD